MHFNTSITISVLPDRLYKISGPAGVDAFYSGKKVLGSGADNYFIANDTNTLIIESHVAVIDNITITLVHRSYYDAYDGQGGTWAYQPSLDRWTTLYSFRPDWISMVGNRLVTFKDGIPYVHDSSNYNNFYGVDYDTVVAVSHSEAGNITKTYKNISIEGSTPDVVHFRTEVPYVQSSDLRSGTYHPETRMSGDFDIKEGVNYGLVMNDRLSPNTSGDVNAKLLNGDMVRGEVAKVQITYTEPGDKKSLKLVNIGFVPSAGQSTTP